MKNIKKDHSLVSICTWSERLFYSSLYCTEIPLGENRSPRNALTSKHRGEIATFAPITLQSRTIQEHIWHRSRSANGNRMIPISLYTQELRLSHIPQQPNLDQDRAGDARSLDTPNITGLQTHRIDKLQ